MQMPIHTPDESATAIGAFFCLVWLVVILWWIAAKSRGVADTVAWFRKQTIPSRIFALLVLLALIAIGGSKNGGTLGMRPPAATAVEPPPPEAPSPSLAVVSVWTNGVALRAESTNAVEITAFRRVGGTEIGDWIEIVEPFFAIGTNPVSRCYVSASGSVSFETHRRPPVGMPLPDTARRDGSPHLYPVLCPLRAHLGMVPEANGGGASRPGEPLRSRF